MPTPRGPDTDKRSEERKQAERLYLESKGNIKLVEIAEKLGEPEGTIKSRLYKARHILADKLKFLKGDK